MACTHIKSGSYCKVCEVKPLKKKVKKIRHMSNGYKAKIRLYSKNRRLYLLENPICLIVIDNKICQDTTVTVHHKEGRIGNLLLDETKWLACCIECHRYIEDNPLWAKENNYSLTRLK